VLRCGGPACGLGETTFALVQAVSNPGEDGMRLRVFSAVSVVEGGKTSEKPLKTNSKIPENQKQMQKTRKLR
jgi:hypothetical protein